MIPSDPQSDLITSSTNTPGRDPPRCYRLLWNCGRPLSPWFVAAGVCFSAGYLHPPYIHLPFYCTLNLFGLDNLSSEQPTKELRCRFFRVVVAVNSTVVVAAVATCSRKNLVFLFGAWFNLTVRIAEYFYLSYSARTIFPSSTKNWRSPAKHSLPQKSSMGTDVLPSALE